MDQFMDLLPILLPFIILELGLRIYAIYEIVNVEEKGLKLRGNSKVLWILVVAFINFGWLLYFLIGKEQ